MTSTLVPLARRSGMDAVASAYDSGMRVPVLTGVRQMSSIIPDIWIATVARHRRDLLSKHSDVARTLDCCRDKTSSYAMTLEAWRRVLSEEIAAFDNAVKRESRPS